jgi:hypothetical protein
MVHSGRQTELLTKLHGLRRPQCQQPIYAHVSRIEEPGSNIRQGTMRSPLASNVQGQAGFSTAPNTMAPRPVDSDASDVSFAAILISHG